MQWSASKPLPIARREVEINDGGKAESEIGAGNLRTIGGPQFRMSIDRIIIKGRGMTGVHVGIDQSGNQKSSAAIDPSGMPTGN